MWVFQVLGLVRVLVLLQVLLAVQFLQVRVLLVQVLLLLCQHASLLLVGCRGAAGRHSPSPESSGAGGSCRQHPH